MRFLWHTPAGLNFPQSSHHDYPDMRSPIAALTWEIYRRGRRSAALVLACIAAGAILNGIIPDSNHALFSTVFGILMVLSFAFLLGLLNCTEFNSTREWNGFPYRLFALPVPTWQLVAVPMLVGLGVVELLYFAWIKLVWTHGQIVHPEWYAAVLGAYLSYYQMTLWNLAGFRILRTIVLSVGGVSGILVAVLPQFGKLLSDSSWWLSETRLLLIVVATIPAAFLIAWIAVERQRHGGGRGTSWTKVAEWVLDLFPRRTKKFSSPNGAQLWFEWRRSGFLLPAAVGFALLVILAPLSWKFGDDAHFTLVTLCWIIAIPVVLASILGKGFAKADFYSRDLSVPSFLAVRPMSCTEMVAAKLKVAAISVLITWLFVAAFLAAWFPQRANSSQMELIRYELQFFYPHSWRLIIAFSFIGLIVLTWRCLIGEMWSGLSGKPSYYFGSIGWQVIGPLLALLVCAIYSNEIDAFIKLHPQFLKYQLIQITGWVLAAMVMAKVWVAAFTWSKIDSRRARQYSILWVGGTLCLLTLAVLARPPMDVERQEHVFLLVALLLFPFARVGATPPALGKNRAR
jgi:hypothetical protein